MNPANGRYEIMGCMCAMDVAVWVKFKNCWLWETLNGDTDGAGWPNDLNGDTMSYGRRIIAAIARKFKTVA